MSPQPSTLAEVNISTVPPPSGAGVISLRKATLLGLLAALGGVVCLLVAWLGVSGTRVVSDQLSYMASGTVTGLFLLGVGAGVLFYDLASYNSLQLHLLQLQVEELRYGALLGDELSFRRPTGSQPTVMNGHVAGPQRLVTLPGSDRVHRSTCALVQSRANAEDIEPHRAIAEALTPCRVCKPELSALVTA